MEFRHELKHRINMADYHILRTRLAAVMKLDPHSDSNGCYLIRSLYFDNYNDKALREKIDGVSHREKFRIRCYNGDSSYIRLEKKSKRGSLNNKLSAILEQKQAEAIIRADWKSISAMEDPLIQELYTKMRCEGLRPKTIVQYKREAYIYTAGNVRITFDSQLKSGLFHTGLFDSGAPMVTPLEPVVLLEVKYDAFLPDIIARLLQLGDRHAAAFSKYAACRVYG